jgi:hypothetical protein
LWAFEAVSITGGAQIGYYYGDDTTVNLPSRYSASLDFIEIVYGSFSDNKNIVNVIIPEGIEKIANNAFSNCIKLETLILPSSVTEIVASAFSGCAGLKIVYYNGDSTSYNEINIDATGNQNFIDAVHYYSETQPEENGQYWHYVDGVPTVWPSAD